MCDRLVVWSGTHGLLIWQIAKPGSFGGYLIPLPTPTNQSPANPLYVCTTPLKLGEGMID